jgi:hypothetical protein
MNLIKISCEEFATSIEKGKLTLLIENPTTSSLIELFKVGELSDTQKQEIIAEVGIEFIQNYFDEIKL